jgi:hypothetical protein
MTSTIKVNTIQNTCGADIIKESSNTITLGASGDTVTLASGASQSGFGRTGTVDWQTTVKTSGFTASDGEGYFLNTTSGGFTVNLPAGSAGSIVAFKDYANTWDTGNVTVTPNGSDKIGGIAASTILSTEAQSITLIFTDSTRGWIDIHDSTSNVQAATFMSASGGNAVLTCGNFKTHIFTGPGTFTVCSVGNPSGSDSVDYLVVAGGASGGSSSPAGAGSGTGGGGAGGFRLANSLGLPAPTTSPLANPSSLPVSVQGYPITVGGGAATASSGANAGNNGNPSVFSTITSTGGGGGGGTPAQPGATGGSGGGGGYASSGGAGNTPPVSPPQGNSGGSPSSTGPQFAASGGGGAGAAGSANPANDVGGAGGVGSYIADSFIGPTAPSYGTPGPVGSTRFFAGGGGGGGGIDCGASTTGGAGGSGGGGAGGNSGSGAPGSQGAAGTANTGGGGGGSAGTPSPANGGGSGIVMIRYRFQ